MLKIKDWFLNKNFTSNESYAISVSELSIERETEKAYYLKALSDFGTLKFWCPKSCIYEWEPAQAFEIGETVCTKAFGEAIVCEINEQMNAVSVKLENGEIKHLLNSSEFIWKV